LKWKDIPNWAQTIRMGIKENQNRQRTENVLRWVKPESGRKIEKQISDKKI